MVECAGLEIRYTVPPYRGFESLLLRQKCLVNQSLGKDKKPGQSGLFSFPPQAMSRRMQEALFSMLFPYRRSGTTAHHAIEKEKAPQINDLRGLFWWAVQGSNLRPLPCEGSALPLS